MVTTGNGLQQQVFAETCCIIDQQLSKMVCMAPYQKAKEILRPQPIDVTFCDTQMFFNLAGQLGIFHMAEGHIGMNYYQKYFLKQNSTFGATNVRRPKFLDVCPVQLGGLIS